MSNAQQFTEKTARFIAEYAKSNHGHNAALAAGYSPRSAKNQASAILKKPGVAEAIEKLRGMAVEVADRETIADINEVKEMLTKIIRADMSELMTNGRLDSKKIQDADLSAVAEITELKTGLKVTMHSKMVAADRLAKLGGWDKGGNAGTIHFHLTNIEMQICGQTQKEPKEIEVSNEN